MNARKHLEEIQNLIVEYHEAVFKKYALTNSEDHSAKMAARATEDMQSVVYMEMRVSYVDEVKQMIRDKTNEVYLAAQAIVDRR